MKGHCLPTRFLQEIPNFLCHIQSGIVMEENHITTKETGTFSSNGILQVFQCGAVPVGINCLSMFSEVYQLYVQRVRKMVASSLPAACVIPNYRHHHPNPLPPPLPLCVVLLLIFFTFFWGGGPGCLLSMLD